MKFRTALMTAVAVFCLSPAFADGYDLTTKSIDELVVDSAAAASGDYLVRYDASANKFVKIDATSISSVTGLTATAVELNNVADNSARVAEIQGTLSLDCATHGTGAINYVSSANDSSNPLLVTLPAATGSGCSYELVWKGAPANGTGDVIQVTGTDELVGVFFSARDTDDVSIAFPAIVGGDNDEITFNSTTKGGLGGALGIRLIDSATGEWRFEGVGNSNGSEVTPFATGQRS